jgi:hypothetical protein
MRLISREKIKVTKYPLYPFLPAIFFALIHAVIIICGSGMYAHDNVLFVSFYGVFFLVSGLFLFVGLIGLAIRRNWALWLLFALWFVWLFFVCYDWYCLHESYYPYYSSLYRQTLCYFLTCILACWFGLWKCKRLNRRSTD